MTYSNALPETLVSIVTLTKEEKGQDRRETRKAIFLDPKIRTPR